MKNLIKKLIRHLDHWLHRPKWREVDVYGQVVCWNCRQATNRHYTLHDKLQCWNCGAALPALHPDKKSEISNHETFKKNILEKYGDKAAERTAHFDALNYHPNDRRRCIKVDPQDYEHCKEHGLLFIRGCRIVNEEYKSAV